MQNDLNSLKNTMLQSLNKKADYTLLDKLNEAVAKKVDNESVKTGLSQLKHEMSQNLEILRNEINIDRGTRESKMQEKLDRADINSEKALDEIYQFKEQIRHLQDERKRDIEETADFIKQLMDTQKHD